MEHVEDVQVVIETNRSNEADKPRANLTKREMDVLKLVSEGYQSINISVALSISEYTSRKYIRNMKAKLGAYTLAHAVYIAVKQGLI